MPKEDVISKDNYEEYRNNNLLFMIAFEFPMASKKSLVSWRSSASVKENGRRILQSINI